MSNSFFITIIVLVFYGVLSKSWSFTVSTYQFKYNVWKPSRLEQTFKIIDKSDKCNPTSDSYQLTIALKHDKFVPEDLEIYLQSLETLTTYADNGETNPKTFIKSKETKILSYMNREDQQIEVSRVLFHNDVNLPICETIKPKVIKDCEIENAFVQNLWQCYENGLGFTRLPKLLNKDITKVSEFSYKSYYESTYFIDYLPNFIYNNRIHICKKYGNNGKTFTQKKLSKSKVETKKINIATHQLGDLNEMKIDNNKPSDLLVDHILTKIDKNKDRI